MQKLLTKSKFKVALKGLEFFLKVLQGFVSKFQMKFKSGSNLPIKFS